MKADRNAMRAVRILLAYLTIGLYHKLHGVPRPVAMKKTVIKRRKRVPAVGTRPAVDSPTPSAVASPAPARMDDMSGAPQERLDREGVSVYLFCSTVLVCRRFDWSCLRLYVLRRRDRLIRSEAAFTVRCDSESCAACKSKCGVDASWAREQAHFACLSRLARTAARLSSSVQLSKWNLPRASQRCHWQRCDRTDVIHKGCQSYMCNSLYYPFTERTCATYDHPLLPRR